MRRESIYLAVGLTLMVMVIVLGEFLVHEAQEEFGLSAVFTYLVHSSLLLLSAAIVVLSWIQNARERLRAQAAAEEYDRVQEVMKGLVSISIEDAPVEEVLGRALDWILYMPVLKVERRGGIWLTDESSPGRLILKVNRGLSEEIEKKCAAVDFGQCICGRTTSEARLIHTGSTRNGHDITYPGMSPHGYYCAPLVYGGKVQGVLNLYVEEGHVKDENEVRVLEGAADILAGIVERKRVEARMEERLAVEEALARASELFITQEEPALNEVLGILAEAVGADRAYIFILKDDGARMDNTHEWCSPSTTPWKDRLQDIDTSNFPWWMERIRSEDYISLQDVDTLPPEAAAEKDIFRAESIRSILSVPIMGMDGVVNGFLGFDDTSRPRAWSGEDIRLLKVMSSILTTHFAQQRAEETIRKMAYYDYLTGLPNRRLLLDRVEQVLSRGKWKRRLSALLFLDLDRFKFINDTLGHSAGDILLKVVAERLSGCLHDGDTVARLGGDEFTILLHELRVPEDILRVIKKVYSALEKPVDLGGHDVYITTSIGVSIYPYDGDQAAELLEKADTAMYRAKEEGRNTYRIYRPLMNERALHRLRTENMLRKAVDQDEFVLHYQPQVSLSTGKINALEALIRWDSPSSGLIPPAEFIPVAEETGLIVPIGKWVLEKACEQIKKFHQYGFTDLRIAVNISSCQFSQPEFTDEVKSVIEKTGLEPGSLELELTESVIMDNTEEVISTMAELKALGIRFTIDDFGTGYSSLSYLKRLPIDTLKVDKSFVQNIQASPDDESIVIAIIRLAHSLKHEVVAEGVETIEQIEFLKKLMCDNVQGYFFSKPLPEIGVLDLLKEGRTLCGEEEKLSLEELD